MVDNEKSEEIEEYQDYEYDERAENTEYSENPAINAAFALFGLICVAVAGIWGAVTVNKRILFVQTVPAATALALGWFA